MQLTLWTYEGPPHVGAMRVATAMRDVHYVMHAPQGDTYADLLFTMIERRSQRPPVTYTTFQARDLGGDTAVGQQSGNDGEEVARHFEPVAREEAERVRKDVDVVIDQPFDIADEERFRVLLRCDAGHIILNEVHGADQDVPVSLGIFGREQQLAVVVQVDLEPDLHEGRADLF